MSDATSNDDPYDLARFVDAQEGVYEEAIAELRAGRKRSHWMWFIFPQLAGLGRSETARFFGIKSLDEAKAYLAHPVLGPRLRACAEAILSIEGRSAYGILGFPDDVKLKSSMTLFDAASEITGSVFERVLAKFYAGKRDEQTLRMLDGEDRLVDSGVSH